VLLLKLLPTWQHSLATSQELKQHRHNQHKSAHTDPQGPHTTHPSQPAKQQAHSIQQHSNPTHHFLKPCKPTKYRRLLHFVCHCLEQRVGCSTAYDQHSQATAGSQAGVAQQLRSTNHSQTHRETHTAVAIQNPTQVRSEHGQAGHTHPEQ